MISSETRKVIDKNLVKPFKTTLNASARLVEKKPGKDGSKKRRLVIDFRRLISKTLPGPYLIPNTIEILNVVGKRAYHTSIDMVSGLHQIRMRPSDTHKTAFSVHPLDRFEFLVMPFKLINASRTF